ncbi:Ribose-phosphate pyrophosphokinase [compost metagenome]
MKERGARNSIVCATHGLFSGPALDRLENPGIEEVVVTDSIALPEGHSSRFTVLSVAPMLARATRIIIEGGSIDKLLEDAGI